MDLLEEKQLIEASKNNKEAFGELFDDNYDKIFNYVLKRTCNIKISEDIVSDVFFKALESIHKFKFKDIKFSSYLYRIANNEVMNFYRKNKKTTISLEYLLEEKHFEIADNNDPQSEIIEAQKTVDNQKDFLKINKFILKLPFKYQEVINLKFFEKKKIKEISEILNKNEGTIKSLISRAISKLKNKMQPFERETL